MYFVDQKCGKSEFPIRIWPQALFSGPFCAPFSDPFGVAVVWGKAHLVCPVRTATFLIKNIDNYHYTKLQN